MSIVQIAEEIISKRTLPVNLQLGDEYLFKHEIIRHIQSVNVYKIHSIYMNHNGLIYSVEKDSYPQAFYFYNDPFLLSYFKLAKILLLKWLRKKLMVINNPVIYITDQWSGGYFHWICEVLPRLVTAKNKIPAAEILLPITYKKFGFVEDSLKNIGYSEFRYLVQDEFYKFNNLYFVSHFSETGIFNDKAIRDTRAELIKYGGETITPNKKVYISRKKAAKRRINNEASLMEILKKNDFEIVYAEDLTFNDQCLLFKQTKMLVTNHGAGLTNMIYMQVGSIVLELRYQNDSINNCYFALASALSLPYYYLECLPVLPKDNPHNSDIIVDVTKFKSILNSIIIEPCAEY